MVGGMAKKKNPVAQALVAMRNKKLTAEQRKEIAKKAAQARWAATASSKRKKRSSLKSDSGAQSRATEGDR
jgi:hypothetical protein